MNNKYLFAVAGFLSGLALIIFSFFDYNFLSIATISPGRGFNIHPALSLWPGLFFSLSLLIFSRGKLKGGIFLNIVFYTVAYNISYLFYYYSYNYCKYIILITFDSQMLVLSIILSGILFFVAGCLGAFLLGSATGLTGKKNKVFTLWGGVASLPFILLILYANSNHTLTGISLFIAIMHLVWQSTMGYFIGLNTPLEIKSNFFLTNLINNKKRRKIIYAIIFLVLLSVAYYCFSSFKETEKMSFSVSNPQSEVYWNIAVAGQKGIRSFAPNKFFIRSGIKATTSGKNKEKIQISIRKSFTGRLYLQNGSLNDFNFISYCEPELIHANMPGEDVDHLEVRPSSVGGIFYLDDYRIDEVWAVYKNNKKYIIPITHDTDLISFKVLDQSIASSSISFPAVGPLEMYNYYRGVKIDGHKPGSTNLEITHMGKWKTLVPILFTKYVPETY